MAAHYEIAILPARPRRPRHKAKVEAAVLMIECWLLGQLRHHPAPLDLDRLDKLSPWGLCAGSGPLVRCTTAIYGEIGCDGRYVDRAIEKKGEQIVGWVRSLSYRAVGTPSAVLLHPDGTASPA
jgi:hypothetical protein